MFARLRLVGVGAVAGIAVKEVGRMQADDPDALAALVGAPPRGKKNVVALVKMSGVIQAPRPGQWIDKNINLSSLDKHLTSAFKGCRAVAIELNSPGGSPVQSALLHNRLKALRKEHPETPLLCFCTDVCASGGYYVASACDEILCLPSSVLGSIGVLSPSLGLTGLMKQYGLEDRTLTAGSSKAGDRPTAPRRPIEVVKKQLLLEELHHDFKQSVTAARGDKLKHKEAAAYALRCGERKSSFFFPLLSLFFHDEALFDGSVYGGRSAVQLGLADGLYDEMSAALKARFGDAVKIRQYGPDVGMLQQLQGMQQAAAETLAAALVREAGEQLALVLEAQLQQHGRFR
mmetsp:Transcript_14110/g.23448  ORF Transcript_14110/g.23448 Transcript_14110/m.23448 type:complete len:346 (+) Transcript_14110:126-1163(+)